MPGLQWKGCVLMTPTPEWVIEQMRRTMLKLHEEKSELAVRYEELQKVNFDLREKLAAMDANDH